VVVWAAVAAMVLAVALAKAAPARMSMPPSLNR
jgi:hypothetical protein